MHDNYKQLWQRNYGWISTLLSQSWIEHEVFLDEINHYTVGHVGSESGQKDQLRVAIYHSLSLNGIVSG